MNFPRPNDPLILHYRGRIPALKNDKILLENGDGEKNLIPNETVTNFFKRAKSIKRQVERQNFTRMPFPMPVACYVVMYTRILQKHGIPTSDGDNAYTTIQETWQAPQIAKTLGAVLGVIDDDRQVMDCHWTTIAVPTEQLQGATAFLWEYEPLRGSEQRRQFMDWYENYLLPDEGWNDETIDFDDLGDLY